MKICKIKIKNYRLLKDFELDLEQVLSLVIGKNNSGKTSLIAILDKFINEKSVAKDFTCDDFNIDFQKSLKAKVENNEDYGDKFLGISCKLFIEYDEKDDLVNLSKVLMDLDPDNKTVVIGFEYVLHPEQFIKLKKAYFEYKEEQLEKIIKKYFPTEDSTDEDKKLLAEIREQKKAFIFYNFFKKNSSKFFQRVKKTIAYDLTTQMENDNEFIDLSVDNISLDKIINLKIVSAKRDVSNKDGDKSLSSLSSRYYEKNEGAHEDSNEIKQFKDTLSETDNHLDIVYEGLFKPIIDKVDLFGGIKKGDTTIKVISSLQHRELLKGNTTVMYDHNEEHSLPEHYNGLGYMNLIEMIFEIEVLLTDFRKDNKENEKPADINLLFIEEPEAHTHPQMQYVFINNIKEILLKASLGEGGTKPPFTLQTIITTHSSHITAESQFNDIKYFTKKNKNEIVARNLKDLEKEYADDGQIESFKFLKQYLTLNRAELFFADKAIFIEGDTERILLPAMMKKLDIEFPTNPLLSQNISLIEVGAYSHIYEKFINFIGLKSLIITDIDGGIEKDVASKAGGTTKRIVKSTLDKATHTTNASLKFFHSNDHDFKYYLTLAFDYKIRRRKPRTKNWVANRKGPLLVVYQIPESNADAKNYHARSFEDAFFHLNKGILKNPAYEFKSLVNIHLEKYLNDEIEVYDFVTTAVDKKPSLAMEILLNSKMGADNDPYSNWSIPNYIKEGLLWLKKD